MTNLLTLVLSLLPTVAMRIAAKVLCEDALQAYLESVIIFALQKLTPLTTNTLDDEIAARIIERLKK